MTDIISEYDHIICAHPNKVQEAISVLEDELERRNCKFGAGVIPTFLKPVFLSREIGAEVAYVLKHIVQILDKVTRLYFEHPQLREYYYLNQKGAELIEIDHGYRRNVVIARPDSFLVNGVLRFVEFNCDSPAGMGLSDTAQEAFEQTFPIQEIARKYNFSRPDRRAYLLKALLETYEEFGGCKSHPNIAIVDWREVRTQNEFQIIRKYFIENGCETIIADPRDLKYINGRLEHDGFPIDLIYRRVIFKELVAKLDEVQGFIQAFKAGKVCVVNPLRSRLASNKALLAIISNQKDFRHLFSAEENQIIKRHVPWTRRVLDIQTHVEENPVFLRKHTITHKDSLVLKPADSYGGKDVVVGRECDQTDWEILLNKILSEKLDYVVQRYVDITEMDVPVVRNGRVDLVTKKYNLNPYVFNDRYAGSVARLSDESVINVSAGGGLVPVIEYTCK